MNSKISIVTVTYNSSNNIENFLESLVKSKKGIEEVIIIENNSPDKYKTESICKKYSKKISINFSHSENLGFSISCNLGARKAKCENILFLNPDTELMNSSLDILISHMTSSSADIMGGRAFHVDGKPHGSVVRSPNLFIGVFEFTNLGKILRLTTAHNFFYYDDLSILDSEEDVEVNVVSGAYLLIKKRAFMRLGGFDENIFMYLEDVDLCKRATDLKMKVVFCPHSTIFHLGGASSKNKYKIRHQAWFDSRKYYFCKHFDLFSNSLIQPLFVIEEFLLKTFRKL